MSASIIGIDPGGSGGIAALTEGYPPQAWKMPETDRDLLDLLRQWRNNALLHGTAFAYIEKVAAMPQSGRASMFKFGQHYGALRMALIALEIPFDGVTPQVWQKTLHCLSKGNKNITKAKAQELFPALKVTHALADALLIASYGWTKQNGRPYS